jgi:hypothetical protein
MFEVEVLKNGRYGVIEVSTGKRVGFSFRKVLYAHEEWGNWHSAFSFCARLEASLTSN